MNLIKLIMLFLFINSALISAQPANPNPLLRNAVGCKHLSTTTKFKGGKKAFERTLKKHFDKYVKKWDFIVDASVDIYFDKNGNIRSIKKEGTAINKSSLFATDILYQIMNDDRLWVDAVGKSGNIENSEISIFLLVGDNVLEYTVREMIDCRGLIVIYDGSIGTKNFSCN